MSEIFEINSGKQILGNYPSKNILLINAYYQRGTKEHPDVCSVIFKDTSTGKKFVEEFENPLLKMYVVKEPYLDFSYYPEFKKKSECDVWLFPYHSVLKYILKTTNNDFKALYKHCRDTANYEGMKILHHSPSVLGTDFPYEDYFRIEWMLNYADKDINTKITKTYADIEVDGVSIQGMAKHGECPINAITLVDEEELTCHTFLLRNDKNPQIKEFEENFPDFVKLCHEKFDEFYGELEYRAYMYDEADEIKMIAHFFRLVNSLKRDFLLFWNRSFDIPYIMDRIKVLGYDPVDIMCPSEIKYPYCYYRFDRSNFDFKTKTDVFRWASYTVCLDQMTNYVKVRKGQSELPSVKLNVIAKKELKDEKLDYSDEATIKTLPYRNYKKFVLYNIKDVLLQLGIERKTKDMEAIFQRAYENATDYDSIFKQTKFLKNRVFLDYYRDLDIIKGNNVNINYLTKNREEPEETDDDEEDDTKKKKKKGFSGALVGDPLNNCHEGMMIYGERSKFVFNNVIDFDFSSLYPSIIISHNIGQNPLIGKIIMEDDFRELNGDPDDERYDPAKELFEDFESQNYSKLGERWLNLPSTEKLLKIMEERNGKFI